MSGRGSDFLTDRRHRLCKTPAACPGVPEGCVLPPLLRSALIIQCVPTCPSSLSSNTCELRVRKKSISRWRWTVEKRIHFHMDSTAATDFTVNSRMGKMSITNSRSPRLCLLMWFKQHHHQSIKLVWRTRETLRILLQTKTNHLCVYSMFYDIASLLALHQASVLYQSAMCKNWLPVKSKI